MKNLHLVTLVSALATLQILKNWPYKIEATNTKVSGSFPVFKQFLYQTRVRKKVANKSLILFFPWNSSKKNKKQKNQVMIIIIGVSCWRLIIGCCSLTMKESYFWLWKERKGKEMKSSYFSFSLSWEIFLESQLVQQCQSANQRERSTLGFLKFRGPLGLLFLY